MVYHKTRMKSRDFACMRKGLYPPFTFSQQALGRFFAPPPQIYFSPAPLDGCFSPNIVIVSLENHSSSLKRIQMYFGHNALIKLFPRIYSATSLASVHDQFS
jgi:hypothetical protein